jgi:hypothetical protein
MAALFSSQSIGNDAAPVVGAAAMQAIGQQAVRSARPLNGVPIA